MINVIILNIAPEVLVDDEYGIEVDVWSVGCVAYFM